MPVGGDIIEITYSHPVLGNGTFYPKAGGTNTLKFGGFVSTIDGTNTIGQAVNKMSQTSWSAVVTIIWDMNLAQNELEVIHSLQDSTQEGVWTLTHINGSIWAGLGRPTGEHNGNTQNATIDLTLGGGGKLRKIA